MDFARFLIVFKNPTSPVVGPTIHGPDGMIMIDDQHAQKVAAPEKAISASAFLIVPTVLATCNSYFSAYFNF